MLIEESSWRISGCSLYIFFNFDVYMKIFLIKRVKSNSKAGFPSRFSET